MHADAHGAAGPRLALGLGQQRGRDPAAAGLAVHAQAAEARGRAAVDQQPARADHGAGVVDRDQLHRLVVEPVAVGRQVDALLVGEDLLAQVQRGLALGRVARAADLDGRTRAHRYSSMSAARSASSRYWPWWM